MGNALGFSLETAPRKTDTASVTSAIIVAAGRGTRMGPNIDKLFLEVAGRPVVAHTWMRLDQVSLIDEIILVIRDGMQSAFTEVAASLSLHKPHRLVIGGQERQDSVWNGLQALSPQCQIVAIQDGARPCTSVEIIANSIIAAREVGAAVAAQRVTDTIKESNEGRFIDCHLDRARLWSVQTPQTFRVETIRRALAAVREKALRVTDDTAACELIGQPVKLVENGRPNPKVTVPADLPYIELLMKSGL